MGIVPSAFIGHCAKPGAGTAEAELRPLPADSSINVSKNARRKITEPDTRIKIAASLGKSYTY